MLRHELFKKLTKVNKDDRILLLTHDDADGAGAEIVLRCMFPEKNIEVVHLNNGVMSERIREALTDAAIAESFGKVIACDISCNEADAEYIDSLPDINSRFVLLDHHLTSQYINRYSWGVSFGDMLEDSFLVNYYSNGHSSGTSLILDYMYYCGINFLPDASCITTENICLWISAYDTWDWKTCFEGNYNFKDENLLFAAYGNNLYVRRRLSKIGLPPIYYSSDADRIMLKAEKAKRKEHVENIKNQIKFGTLDIPMEDYIYACKTDTDKYAKEIEKKYSRYIDGNTLPRFSLKHIISSSKGASSKTVLLYILPLDNENQIHFEGGKFVSPEEIEADEHNYSSFLKEEIEHLDVVAQMWKEFK